MSPEWKRKVGSATSVQLADRARRQRERGRHPAGQAVRGSIGYVELIYAISNKLPYADVKNEAGKFVEPSLKSVSAAAAGADLKPETDFRVSITNAPGAEAYPISSFTWLLVRSTIRMRPRPEGSGIS